MAKSIPLQDLIDFGELQAIQDSFASTTGTSSVIFSPEGVPLTLFSNPNGFCSLIQSTDEGKKRCFQCFMEMSRKALKLKEPKILYCFAHGGHFVAPIIIDGVHKGTMFSGQFIPQEFSPEQLKAIEKLAGEINLDPGLLLEKARNMRVVKEDVVWNYSNLLFQIVRLIAKLGAQKAGLSRAKQELQKAHYELEIRVQERTAELTKNYEELKQEITERKQAEKALRESEDKYRNIYHNTQVGLYRSRLSDGKMLMVNNRMAEIFGYDSPEKTVAEYVASEHYVDPGAREKLLDIISEHNKFTNFETLMTKRDGSPVWIQYSGTLVSEKGYFEGVATDITEQKKAEKALRESEGKYRSLINDVLDTSDIGIFILDVEFKVVWINHSTEKYFGLKREDVIGKDKRQLIRKRIKDIFEDPETFKQKVSATYDNNTYIENFEFHVLPDKERKEYWLEHWSQPIRSGLYKGGRIEHYSDITKRKQAEKELAKYRDHLEDLVKERTRDLEAAHEELIKHERLSVLGQLTTTVSHDLRNPLGVIRSSSFYVQRKLGSTVDEKITKHLNRIEKQIDLCDTIVGDLLEYTRGRSSEVIHGKINPLLEEILEETTTPEQVALVSDFSPELPMVLFDRDKMRRVMINLIQNAFKAVNLRRDMWNDEEGPYQPLVKVTSSKADNGIRIKVEDNGTGMDDETTRRAFEPLFTRWARGTGLGLAIVKKIVEEHSGSVSLESIPDHGTKVTIVIPTETQSDDIPVSADSAEGLQLKG